MCLVMVLYIRMLISSLCPSPQCFPTSRGPWNSCGLSVKDITQNKPVSSTRKKCLLSGHMGISNKSNFNILFDREKKKGEMY